MATPGAIAKRTEKRQVEILKAVQTMVAEIAELKIKIGEPDAIELKAEIDETEDRTDEIKVAIHSAALDITEQASKTVAVMMNEMANLKAEIAELKAAIRVPPATRRTKK